MRLLAIVLCTLTLAAAEPQRGVLVENVATLADASQTYTLYLPNDYDKAKRHPLLFVFDPRGRGSAAAEIFREAADEYGWVLISANGTASDDDGDGSERAVRALLPEVRRYAIETKRVYAAGFSGTAILAWSVGIRTKALAGVIGVGGRLSDATPPSRFHFAHFGFAGETDFNNREMRVLDAQLENVPHRFESFDGDHRWITPDLARLAFGWFEALATGSQTDLSRDLAGARSLETAGKLTAALRRYRAMVRTYDSDDARAAVERLENEPRVQAALRDEERWDAFEARFAREVFGSIGKIYATVRQEGTTLTPSRLAHELGVPELRRRAKRDGAEGMTARRLLEAIYTQTSFYLPRQFAEKKEYAFAAATLGVATGIHPDRWPAWYTLGAMHARDGQRRRALDALEKAIAHGFHDAKQLSGDPDYASLRDDPRFQSLLANLK